MTQRAVPSPALSREEAKSITRRRLLDAATRVLAETGYGGLSASAIARAAGVAQPTLYVHFRDKDDLLRTLAEEKIGSLRASLRAARDRVRAGQGIAAVRDTFRLPLETWAGNPTLFRIYVQELHQPGSPLGKSARQLRAELRNDLVEDLIGFGMPAETPAARERLDMIAEAMIAQTEALGLGVLEGRYENLDAAIDVLTAFTVGVLGLTPP